LGGLLWNANLVENYPGFPNGIPGERLAQTFAKQAKTIGVNCLFAEVEYIAYSRNSFVVGTEKIAFRTDYLILATGTLVRGVSLPGFDDLPGDRMAFDVSELRGVTGKRVAILGAGYAAYDQALTLFKRNTVTINNRNTSPACLELLSERVTAQPSITVRHDITLTKVGWESDQVQLYWRFAGKPVREAVDYLLFATGREPNLCLLEDGWGDWGKLIATERLFIIGDAQNDRFRQTGIAVGDGLLAAMAIYQQIRDRAK